MGSLPVIGWQPLSDIGAIMAGAKAYFYRTGTSTPKNTYSNSGLTSANANPVVADAYGRFGDVFLLKDEGYRCVLKTSADVTIYTEDEVFSSSIAVDEQTRRIAIARSPIDSGAVGDGVTNDAVALQAAITAAGTGVLDLEGKTYRCDSALSVQSGLTLRNGTLDFSACNADDCILAEGSLGGQVLLSGDEAAGQTTLSVASISGLAAGDLLLLQEGAGASYGELIRVSSASGATVDVAAPIFGSYTTGGGAGYKKVTSVDDVLFSDLTLIGNTASSGAGRLLSVKFADGVRVENCSARSTKSGAAAISIKCSRNAVVSRTTIEGAGIGIAVTDASYGARISDCALERCTTGVDIGTNVDSRGNTIDTVVSGIQAAGGTTAVYVEKYAKLTLVDDSTLRALSYGVRITGTETTVRGCFIAAGTTSTTGGVYVDFVTSNLGSSGGGIVIADCVFSGGGTLGNVLVSSTSYALSGVSVRGCVLNIGIYLNATTSGALADITIEGNRTTGTYLVSSPSTGIYLAKAVIAGNTGTGRIDLVGDTNNYDISDAVIANNVIQHSSGGIGFAIFLKFVTRATVIGNTIETSEEKAIYVDTKDGTNSHDSVELAVVGNRIRTSHASGYGVYIDAYSGGVPNTNLDNLIVSGNSIGYTESDPGPTTSTMLAGVYLYGGAENASLSGNTIRGIKDSAGATGISLVGISSTNCTSNASIVGNSIYSTQRCLSVDGFANGLVIDGNTMEGGAAVNELVYLNSATAIDILSVVITNNTLREGIYAVNPTNILQHANNPGGLVLSGNVFSGQTTGPVVTSAGNHGVVHSSVVNITATEIVGTASGDLGHASGVTLVAAPGAGLAVEPIVIVIDFTFATGQYGDGGGTLAAKYDGGAACTGTVTTASTVGAAASNLAALHPVSGAILANTKLVLAASAAMTAGAGAGTAQIRTLYRIVDA